jgi:hypothetical protein
MLLFLKILIGVYFTLTYFKLIVATVKIKQLIEKELVIAGFKFSAWDN